MSKEPASNIYHDGYIVKTCTFVSWGERDLMISLKYLPWPSQTIFSPVQSLLFFFQPHLMGEWTIYKLPNTYHCHGMRIGQHAYFLVSVHLEKSRFLIRLTKARKHAWCDIHTKEQPSTISMYSWLHHQNCNVWIGLECPYLRLIYPQGNFIAKHNLDASALYRVRPLVYHSVEWQQLLMFLNWRSCTSLTTWSF